MIYANPSGEPGGLPPEFDLVTVVHPTGHYLLGVYRNRQGHPRRFGPYKIMPGVDLSRRIALHIGIYYGGLGTLDEIRNAVARYQSRTRLADRTDYGRPAFTAWEHRLPEPE